MIQEKTDVQKFKKGEFNYRYLFGTFSGLTITYDGIASYLSKSKFWDEKIFNSFYFLK